MEEKDILDEISKETIRRHQLRRKEQIQKILWDSSFHPNQVAQEKLDKYLGREEKEHIQTENDNMFQLEERKEELEVCGYPYPNKFRHKRKKTSRKRCWVCRSYGHIKNSYPQIRCFYCGKAGHTKNQC